MKSFTSSNSFGSFKVFQNLKHAKSLSLPTQCFTSIKSLKHVEHLTAQIFKTFETLKSFNTSNRPKFLQSPYQLIYRFDSESLLAYYKGIFTNAALERITGIHQKQLQHYATGLRKPRKVQLKKIQTALHQLGNELLAVELYV